MNVRLQSAGLAAALLSLALMGLQGLGACALNPVTGRPDAVLMTEKGEIEQGRKAAEEVEKQMGFVDDDALQAYVDEIGQRLAAHSPRTNLKHYFHVVEMKEPNAFALPGGYIYVSRGLLALLNSEDELANVIGHEIGHVAARHSVTRQAASAPLIPVHILAGIGGAAASIVSPAIGSMVSGVGQLPGAVALATYSRSQETQADEIGQELAAASGWNPIGMSTFMHTLAREEELRARERGDSDGKPARTSFLASHPASPERSEATRKNAPKLTIADEAPFSKDQADFFRRLEGLVIGGLAIEGVFVEEHFLQPEMDFGIRMPVGWEYMNSDSAVVAQTPDKDAMVVLEVADEGGDPLATAHAQAKKSRVKIEPRETTINGFDAVEASVVVGGRGDRKGLQIAWIASGDLVYQITGIAKIDRFDGLKSTFESVIRSFHALSAEDRKLIRENRLRVARAKQGESLEELSKRADSAWSPDQCAVANALDVDSKLAEGLLVKIAHPERYEP